ncbi:MAG: hypothetical protein ACSLFK_06695 [Gemmatimonadaceae bacterium]
MSMRNITIGAIAVLFGSGVEAQAPIPVHAEPRHRMVWEAGSIRVLDVQVPPGDTSLYHIHDAPILYIPIAISSMDARAACFTFTGAEPAWELQVSPRRNRVRPAERERGGNVGGHRPGSLT